MLKMQFLPFMQSLENHQPFDATEAGHLAFVRDFVCKESAAFWQRSTLHGHVTGSAFVVNSDQTHTLLLHHAKLNRWVQPGGHLDTSDESPAAGALREAIEETGLAALSLAGDGLFDVDVHLIPERHQDKIHEPAHYHHDARYLVIAAEKSVTISSESLAFRWVALTELAGGHHESGLVRMAKKLMIRQEIPRSL